MHAIPNKTNSNHKSFCGMGADDELVYTLENPHGILVKLPIHSIVNRVYGTLKMSEYNKRNTVIKSILHSLSMGSRDGGFFFGGRFWIYIIITFGCISMSVCVSVCVWYVKCCNAHKFFFSYGNRCGKAFVEPSLTSVWCPRCYRSVGILVGMDCVIPQTKNKEWAHGYTVSKNLVKPMNFYCFILLLALFRLMKFSIMSFSVYECRVHTLNFVRMKESFVMFNRILHRGFES